MNADFFFKFTKFKFGSLVNAEDFADKINYQWTGSILIISTAIIAMRQYIFTPIQCWVPPEWPRPWEEYTENYCWIQNTYHVKFEGKGHPDKEQRHQQELNYYQWVPFMLALEAMLVYVPHMLWKIITVRSGYNPNSIVKFAADAGTVDQAKKEKLIGFLAQQITKAMNIRKEWRRNNLWSVPSCLRTILPCFWFGKRSGTMVFSLYIANKLLYIIIGIGHIFLMKKFLGFSSLLFGWQCFSNLLKGKHWEETNIFPRVTFCDVPAKRLGQWNLYSIQCVLPVNLLNEKIYIFMWFWTVFCVLLTILSLIMWILRVLVFKNRQHFIKKYLRILNDAQEADDDKERDARKQFVDEFLAFDGIFLLRMISENVGDMCAADIVDAMFKMYMNKENNPNSALKVVKLPNNQSDAGARNRLSSTVMLEPDSPFGRKSKV